MEIRNPAKLPTDLNPAEEKFVRCLAEGKYCMVGNGELPEKEIQSGEGANVVRGEVIRFFAYGGNEEHSVSGPIICLLGAWISEGLDLINASIPYVLRFDNCHFVASVVMQHMECVALYLNGSHLAQGLLADGLTTKSSMNLRNGFSAEGEVRLLGANIGGDLDCAGGKFNNSDGNALFADGLTTKGSVNLRNGFSAEGEVRLLGANIRGNLDCVGGKFDNSDGRVLNVQGSIVSGGLLWRDITCQGYVHLAYAKIDVLADDSSGWESCKVNLDGFTYNRFSNPMDIQSRIDWLANHPDGRKFSPLPYEQAAKVLFGMGHAYDARKILLEKERLQTEHVRMHWLRRVGRRLWDIFAGYGYRLQYTVAWMAVFVALGAVVFGAADKHGNIVPTHPVVAVDKDYKMQVPPKGNLRPTQAVPPEYPAFNPFVFSLDVFTPSAVFHQEDSWGPRSGGGDWLDFDVDILWLLTLWYWLEVAMGWMLTSMLLLSVYGSLRPRQSSSERD